MSVGFLQSSLVCQFPCCSFLVKVPDLQRYSDCLAGYALVEFVDDAVAERALRQHQAFSSRGGETAEAAVPPSPTLRSASCAKTSPPFSWLPTWQLSWAKQNVRPPLYHWQPGMPEDDPTRADFLEGPQPDTPKAAAGADAPKQASGNDSTLK